MEACDPITPQAHPAMSETGFVNNEPYNELRSLLFLLLENRSDTYCYYHLPGRVLGIFC